MGASQPGMTNKRLSPNGHLNADGRSDSISSPRLPWDSGNAGRTQVATTPPVTVRSRHPGSMDETAAPVTAILAHPYKENVTKPAVGTPCFRAMIL
jgi:hypothetical protein